MNRRNRCVSVCVCVCVYVSSKLKLASKSLSHQLPSVTEGGREEAQSNQNIINRFVLQYL